LPSLASAPAPLSTTLERLSELWERAASSFELQLTIELLRRALRLLFEAIFGRWLGSKGRHQPFSLADGSRFDKNEVAPDCRF
jgi:hypothetical protein